MKRTSKPEVYSITGARSGLSQDVSDRTRRYLISMGVRTACFIGAVVTHGPLRWVLFAGALVLPYIAVVMANAGRESSGGERPAQVTPEASPALTEHEDRPRATDPPS